MKVRVESEKMNLLAEQIEELELPNFFRPYICLLWLWDFDSYVKK